MEERRHLFVKGEVPHLRDLKENDELSTQLELEVIPRKETDPKITHFSGGKEMGPEYGRPARITFVNGEKRVEMEKFLPRKYQFFPDTEFACHFHMPLITDTGRIEFVADEVKKTAGGRLALLHEIGHAEMGLLRHVEDPYLQGMLTAMQTHSKLLRERMESIAFSSPEEKRQYIETSTNNFLGIFTEEHKQALPGLLQRLAKNEREAWARALKLYRRIKDEQGVDLLAGTKNKKILECVNSEDTLGWYQKHYEFFESLVPEESVGLEFFRRFLRTAPRFSQG
jgi:hypothetical protein